MGWVEDLFGQLSMTEKSQTAQLPDAWASDAAYERYVGRWSRQVVPRFLEWLNVAPENSWLDVGCGTGTLSEAILQRAKPERVRGIDWSPAFVAHAQERIRDPRASFKVADARALPEEAASYDAVVSGLMLNFVPEPEGAASEMARVVKPGGVVAAYVWDYAGKMEFMRYFWDAAAALDPAVAKLNEALRFKLCQPEPLAELFRGAGLEQVEVRDIEIPTTFKDFDDYWSPFLGGQGPAPTYAMSLTEEKRAALCEQIRASLPIAADGSIALVARVWAVRGAKT